MPFSLTKVNIEKGRDLTAKGEKEEHFFLEVNELKIIEKVSGEDFRRGLTNLTSIGKHWIEK